MKKRRLQLVSGRWLWVFTLRLVQDGVTSALRRRAQAARFSMAVVALAAALLAIPGIVVAHVIVDPADSPAGATQLYTIAVPSEKHSDTVGVEVQFPRTLVVLQLQAPAGWKVTSETDGSGRILGAIWQGGAAQFNEFVAFGVLAQNPNSSTDLSWSAIQTYADGSEVQWFGPETSQFPATVTRVRPGGAELTLADSLAAAALMLSLVALVLAILTWRKQRRAAARQVAQKVLGVLTPE